MEKNKLLAAQNLMKHNSGTKMIDGNNKESKSIVDILSEDPIKKTFE